ncbi:MAG: carboxypeptidase regulatory-like domain-containing protein, partial [bacterium]
MAFTFNAGSMCAQTFRGAIQGTVTDSSGSAVARAQITVTGEQTKFARQVVTDTFGNYLVTELPLGSYRVNVAKTGFQGRIVTGIHVEVAVSSRMDLVLSPGQLTEVIEVVGILPLVETSGNNQGGTIEARQASELPVNGRDFLKTLQLIPGATSDPSSVADAPGSFGTFSINGSRGRSNNYLLDGADMNDGFRNNPAINEPGVWGTPSTILPLDALAEIPVISGADAQFGRNSGAIVNLVTKSGTNQFHGSAFEYFRNSALDARNYFNSTAVPQNPFHNNQFGGSLGGPIVKNKTFFFLAYEGQREYGGLTSPGHIPEQDDIAAALVSPTVVNAGGENPIIANLLARHPWPAANIPTDSNGDNLLATTRFSN